MTDGGVAVAVDPESVRERWANRSGSYSPAAYAREGPNEVSQILTEVLTHYCENGAAVLELGCGSGRHLETLRRAGFQNLTGIDINDEAGDVVADHYPALAETMTLKIGAIEDILPTIGASTFDVVYSVETLQHIPDAETEVFAELPRITRDLVITAENEGNGPTRGRSAYTCVDEGLPLYYRDWRQIFTELGMAQLLCEPTNRDTVRVFRG